MIVVNQAEKPTIVKVQAPSAGAQSGTERYVIYDQNKLHQVEQPVPTSVLRALDGDLKGHFEATWRGKQRGWAIGKRVGDQPW